MATRKGLETQPTDLETDEGRALRVRQSHVRTGGTTRINEGVRAELGGDRRTLVEVRFEGKSVAVHLFADPHVPVDRIVLRRPEMTRLGVPEGGEVHLRPMRSARSSVRDAMGRLGRRVGVGLDVSEPAVPEGR